MSTSPLKRLWPLGLIVAIALAAASWWQARHAAGATAPVVAAPTAVAPAANASAAAMPTSPGPDAPTSDPRAELAKALTNPDARLRAQEFSERLQAWAQRDAHGAVAYVRRMPAGRERSMGVRLVLDALAQRDPDAALRLARELVTNRDEG